MKLPTQTIYGINCRRCGPSSGPLLRHYQLNHPSAHHLIKAIQTAAIAAKIANE